MSKKSFKTLNEITNNHNIKRLTHYRQYLKELCLQLFEWENLPTSIPESYIEKELHSKGYVAFYEDENLGFIATSGAMGGAVDHYNLPTKFKASSPVYSKEFHLLNYNDVENEDDFKYGVLISNNDFSNPTFPSLEMFATELTEITAVMRTNLNAQKTPVLITTTDNQLFSMRNLYSQYEGNTPVIFADKGLDLNSIKVFKTDAPYVIDKLNSQKNAIWNELMTFLGIKNANQEKKERMITAEADSNNEQIESSGNRMLKVRQSAVEKINQYYGLNIHVKIRQEIYQEIERGILNGSIFDTIDDNYRAGDTVQE